jgi:hypothetical protein
MQQKVCHMAKQILDDLIFTYQIHNEIMILVWRNSSFLFKTNVCMVWAKDSSLEV